jgi:hypothetical protein
MVPKECNRSTWCDSFLGIKIYVWHGAVFLDCVNFL